MKRVLKIAGAVVGLLLAIAIVLPFLIDANQFRPLMQSKLSAALGREVKVGNLKLSLLSGGVTADDLSISDDPEFSKTAFVQAKSLRVGIDMIALVFSRRLNVTGLTIDQPQVWLLQAPSGDWNFSSLGSKSAPRPEAAAADTSEAPRSGTTLDLRVKLVKARDGRFTVGRTGGHVKTMVFEKVNAELHDFEPTASFPFALSMNVAGGGSIELDGKAGPLPEQDMLMTPVAIALKIDRIDLAASGLSDMAPAFGGVVSFDGAGSASGGMVDVKGKVKIDKLKLSAKGTPAKNGLELDFQLAHDLKKRSGTVRQADIHFGKAITRATGTYVPQGESMALHMKIAGPDMPVEELAELLPALGLVLPLGSSLKGGTAAVSATVEGPVDRLVTTGEVSLNNTKLTGFDLGSKLSAIERIVGIGNTPDTEIQTLHSKVRAAPEGMTADDILLVLPQVGELSGAGTIHPDNSLNFKMQAAVHTRGIAAVLNNTSVPFTVEGTCAQPSFRADMKGAIRNNAGKAAGEILRGIFGKR